MVRFYEAKTTFDFTWEQVAQGFWQRYPNPESTHVLSEDTTYRQIRDGKLYTKRLLTKTNKIPKWGERFISTKTVKILEESIVDPKNKTLTTYTRNLGMQSIMSVAEKVVYKSCDENPDKTIAIRTATIDSHVFGFARTIQSFGLERFKKNCTKTVRGFNYVLHSMFPQQHKHIETIPHSAAVIQRSNKEKLKDAAKKASDLAKSKTSFPKVESI
ncbi:hypothetical protein V9T40_011485 [Parthenolecanium corni]|uniref:PRELI/MSF1 domain-containing protein n=1 Tax=Parthenolecanium corni TaxID=536013 RepID=A0AAN9T6Z0_9HEMI